MTDKEKRVLKDSVTNIFKRFNILDHTATIGGLRDDILRYIDSLQEESVSEELIDVAKQYVKEHVIGIDKITFSIATDMFISGAKWKEEKDKQVLNEEGVVVLPEEAFERMKRSLIELAEKERQMMAKAIEATVHIDAGGYPYIPQMELYDYDNDVPLAKEGDKYKVILIKEE